MQDDIVRDVQAIDALWKEIFDKADLLEPAHAVQIAAVRKDLQALLDDYRQLEGWADEPAQEAVQEHKAPKKHK